MHAASSSSPRRCWRGWGWQDMFTQPASLGPSNYSIMRELMHDCLSPVAPPSSPVLLLSGAQP